MRLAVEFAAPESLEDGRRCFTVTAGDFAGAELAGLVVRGGWDRVRTRPDGVFQLDIRMGLRPASGGLIEAMASGILDIGPDALERIRAGIEVPPTDYYFRTHWHFATDAPPFLWLNRLLAVGVGTRTTTGMSTELFALR